MLLELFSLSENFPSSINFSLLWAMRCCGSPLGMFCRQMLTRNSSTLPILFPHSSTPVVTLRNPARPTTISLGLQTDLKLSLGTIWRVVNLPAPVSTLSTVLERDHFYSDFLISQTTVSTNFNHLDDESKRPLDRNECPRFWRATLVTQMFSMGVKLRGWL